MANKSLILNDISNVRFVNDDVRSYKKYIQPGSVDVVFSNPPYKRDGSAQDNQNQSKAMARHEKYLPLQDLVECANGMLKFGGRAYFVYDADRSAEMIFELKCAKLQPKRIFFTENGKGKVILFVVEAVKGGKEGVKVLPNLITNDRDGTYLENIKKGVWNE